MKELIIDFFSVLPDDFATFLIAMFPLTELRVAIPIAVTVYHVEPSIAFVHAVLGNVFLGVVTLFFIENLIHIFLVRSQRLNVLWQRYINCLHMKNKENFEKWGAVGLVIFVAIPLPLTGVFSGAIVASIFQIPFRKAIPLLCIGAMIAGMIVTLLTIGVERIF